MVTGETVVRDLQTFSYERQKFRSYIQNSGRSLNSEYWEKLMTRVIMRVEITCFYLRGVRAVITSVKSVKYIWKGNQYGGSQRSRFRSWMQPPLVFLL